MNAANTGRLKHSPGVCRAPEHGVQITMNTLSAAIHKSKTIHEMPPQIPLEADKISQEKRTKVHKDNQTYSPSSAATGRASGTLSGGSSQAFEEARAKRLRDAPARFRQLYKRAWNRKSRKAAIRAFCLECVCWSPQEVAKCTAPACPLYEYRLKG